MATPTSTTNVLKMPARKRVSRLPMPLRSPSMRRRLARQQGAAAAVCFVAVVLTGLSLSHLAHGIELVTKAPTWETWALAVGIDLGFIALEVAGLCAVVERVRREIAWYIKPAIIGTLAASAVMNGLAFGSKADDWMVYPAVGLGLAIPALVYCLSRVAFSLAASR